MKHLKCFLLFSGVMVMAFSNAVFAGTWQQNEVGWYWEEEGMYPSSSWQWLDGNQDGISECYYFNEEGYLLTAGTAPDGSQVDSDGRWTVNGQVQVRVERMQTESEQTLSAVKQYLTAANKIYYVGGSLELETETVLSSVSDGRTFEYIYSGNLKTKDFDNSDVQYISDDTISSDGITQFNRTFYVDGMRYHQGEDGSRNKIEQTWDKAYIYVRDRLNNAVPDILEMGDIKIKEEKNGSKVITYRLTDEIAMDMFEVDGLFEINLDDDGNPRITENLGTIVINPDGYITSVDYRLSSDILVDSAAGTNTYRTSAKFINPGQQVILNLPSTEGYGS